MKVRFQRFDSHLPHEKQLRNAPELFLVIAVSRLLFHEFDSTVLGASLVGSIVGDWLMGSFANRGQAILRDALSHKSRHDASALFWERGTAPLAIPKLLRSAQYRVHQKSNL